MDDSSVSFFRSKILIFSSYKKKFVLKVIQKFSQEEKFLSQKFLRAKCQGAKCKEVISELVHQAGMSLSKSENFDWSLNPQQAGKYALPSHLACKLCRSYKNYSHSFPLSIQRDGNTRNFRSFYTIFQMVIHISLRPLD